MTVSPCPSVGVLAPGQGLMIVNCSREKLVTSAPVPAWELYQGACVPQLRSHFAGDTARRARIRVLSAAHGLLHPDDLISTYDRRLTTRAEALRLHRQTVTAQLDAEFAQTPTVRHLLIVVEPLYLLALQRLFDHLDRLDQIVVVPNAWGWQAGLAHLRCWGWA